jgi:putative DNA primase/helicase
MKRTYTAAQWDALPYPRPLGAELLSNGSYRLSDSWTPPVEPGETEPMYLPRPVLLPDLPDVEDVKPDFEQVAPIHHQGVPQDSDHGYGEGLADFQQAQWLAHYLNREWRYDFATEKWHRFDGVRWAPDQRDQLLQAVADLASDHLRQERKTEADIKRLTQLYYLAPQKRALEALATFEGYGTEGGDWDQDPYLLGVTNGVVDLRTGERRDGRPSDLVTKTTGIEFDPEAECPVFDRFLAQVTEDHDGNPRPELAEYLLLVFGAALLGHTLPQQYWLLYGQPGAGKGALCRTMAFAFGSDHYGYAFEADSNLYTKPRTPRDSAAPRADLMVLKGRRLVYVHEPGSPFDDDMLKKHTGGDRITGRSLHSNIVLSWQATHTIMFSSNHLPAIEDVGAMRRRARVAPFVRNFEDHIDADLEPAMAREAPGILAKLVTYAVRFTRDPGLLIDTKRMPAVVAAESKAYIEDNDPLAQWAAERLVFGRAAKAELHDLLDDYNGWASRPQNGDAPAFTARTFPTAMTKFKAVSKAKTNSRVIFHGVGLRFITPDDDGKD